MDISQLLIDATTVIKVMKQKSSAASKEDLYGLEMDARALRQISNQLLTWVDEKRK
jgi:hypothetical protein